MTKTIEQLLKELIEIRANEPKNEWDIEQEEIERKQRRADFEDAYDKADSRRFYERQQGAY